MPVVFPFLETVPPRDGSNLIPPWNQVLFQTDNFVVVPTVGALVDGWLLIVTRESRICMGAIDDSLRRELEQVVTFFAEALQDCYGNVAMFEHGPSCFGLPVGCGVDHAHLHLLPAPGNLVNDVGRVSSVDLQWRLADGLGTATEYFKAGKAYLYVEQPIGRATISNASEAPSQLFRKVVAYQIGHPEKYDWQSNPMESNVIRTNHTVRRWLFKNRKRVGRLGICE
jgi:diadenosine tetraphosphate (Ap4A) HIT family hydrolase